MEAIKSLFTLKWRQEPQIRPLPDQIQRTFIKSPGGELEVLICHPKHADPTAAPIFFAHGGYGSAGVWLEWMIYLHEAGYGGTLYAYSARNHGASYSVSYLRMVYGTPITEIAADFRLCYDFVRKQEESARGESAELLLVGHSSGGGISQYALAHGLLRCRALCLVDAIPHYGALSVYANWAHHDPWFMLRSLFHFQHPTSPLSSHSLVHGAFFGKSFPRSAVADFARWMPSYESMGWPMAMMGSFSAWWRGSPSWLDLRSILSNVSGVAKIRSGDHICIMIGSDDVLMDLGMARKQVAEYRAALEKATGEKTEQSTTSRPKELKGATVESAGGAQLVIVDGAGHHLQNDLQRDVGAEGLLDFIRQVQ